MNKTELIKLTQKAIRKGFVKYDGPHGLRKHLSGYDYGPHGWYYNKKTFSSLSKAELLSLYYKLLKLNL